MPGLHNSTAFAIVYTVSGEASRVNHRGLLIIFPCLKAVLRHRTTALSNPHPESWGIPIHPLTLAPHTASPLRYHRARHHEPF